MNPVRQRDVGVYWALTLAAVVVPVLVVALVVPQLPAGYSWQRWVVGVPAVLVFVYFGVRPLMWWWGADMRIDDRGVFFGRDRRRKHPPQAAFAARLPYAAPWDAVSDVRLVRNRSAIAAMCKHARSGHAQPSKYSGYFPIRGGRAHLVFRVDLAKLKVLAPRQPRRGSLNPADPMQPSNVWVLPVRRTADVLTAFAQRGLDVATSDEAVFPGPTRATVGPDDPVVTKLLTENLGRPPTEEEMAEIRQKWYDTERYPRRSSD